jgi:hypothetical protein
LLNNEAQRRGGLTRKEKLSPERRSEIAVQAARARWSQSLSVDTQNIEGFQMNTDAIDAADILITELNEQAAMLSQSGVSALAAGLLPEAKLMIDAIEKTQGLRTRAEQLRLEILSLYSSFSTSEESQDEFMETAGKTSDGVNRRQDRTDPALMNAKRTKILDKLEKDHRTRLHRRSSAIYRSEKNEIGVVCAMSKWHDKNENYWYAYHTHQDEFLEKVGKGYFVLGMMDSDTAVVLPLDVIRQNLPKLNTTTTPDRRTYWHIHISRGKGGALWLQRARGEAPLPLDRHVVKLSA